jgi:autotransporter family porin
VRAKPITENKPGNATANQHTGQHIGTDVLGGDDPRANRLIAPRVDGGFTGTTGEILRWVACKWGVDEDIVSAQAAVESWWRQSTKGDFATDASACPPGHGLGVDGTAGKCPQSYGILQTRYPYMKSAWPGIADSTAMSADLAYGIWRACFEGYETWLNTVEQGQHYAAGDAWGCVGRWFSGRWHTAASDGYVTKVRDYLGQKVWQQPNFAG